MQRDVKSALYGFSAPNEHITVTLSGDASKEYQATSSSNGDWKVFIGPFQGGGEYKIAISGSTSSGSVVLEDVTFGDVYFCSGQVVQFDHPHNLAHILQHICLI